MSKIFLLVFILRQMLLTSGHCNNTCSGSIQVVDMTKTTTWSAVSSHYAAIKNLWTICTKCGIPSLGTVLHMELKDSHGSLQPALIPAEYLLSRLVTIDVSAKRELEPAFVLTLDIIQKEYEFLSEDITEPTLLLFIFGWSETDDRTMDLKHCICKVPGISYKLAEYIATNLSHVVGVGTDAPTLESEETRKVASATVANLFTSSGIYMLENVFITKKVLYNGCMALATPMKIMDSNYVPARLIAYCPDVSGNKTENIHVVLVQGNSRKARLPPPTSLPYHLRVNLTNVINYIVGIH